MNPSNNAQSSVRPAVKLAHWSSPENEPEDSPYKSWVTAPFSAATTTKLVPSGTMVQVGEEVFEVEKDMGFYQQNALRLIMKGSGRRVTPSAVTYAVMNAAAWNASPKCLYREEQVFVSNCRKAGIIDVPALEVPNGHGGMGRALRVLDLDPEVELAAVEARLKGLSDRLQGIVNGSAAEKSKAASKCLAGEAERIARLRASKGQKKAGSTPYYELPGFFAEDAGAVLPPAESDKASTEATTAPPAESSDELPGMPPVPASAAPAAPIVLPVSQPGSKVSTDLIVPPATPDPRVPIGDDGDSCLPATRYPSFHKMPPSEKVAMAEDFVAWLDKITSSLPPGTGEVPVKLHWEDNTQELMSDVSSGKITPVIEYAGGQVKLCFPQHLVRREVVGFSIVGCKSTDGKELSYDLFGVPPVSFQGAAVPNQMIPRSV